MEKTDIVVSSENRHLSDNNNLLNQNTTSSFSSSSFDNNDYGMDELLKESQFGFNHMINSQLIKFLKNASGIAFTKVTKAGLGGVGGIFGNGIIMKRNLSSNEWFGPCAVHVRGASIGLELGFEEIYSIFIINDESIFSSSFANNDRNDNNNNNNNNDEDIMFNHEFPVASVQNAETLSDLPKIVSFSFSKGAFVDFGWEKIKITVDHKLNHKYFQNPANPQDIFSGNVKSPDNQYFILCRQLIDAISNDNNNVSSQAIRQAPYHSLHGTSNMEQSINQQPLVDQTLNQPLNQPIQHPHPLIPQNRLQPQQTTTTTTTEIITTQPLKQPDYQPVQLPEQPIQPRIQQQPIQQQSMQQQSMQQQSMQKEHHHNNTHHSSHHGSHHHSHHHHRQHHGRHHQHSHQQTQPTIHELEQRHYEYRYKLNEKTPLYQYYMGGDNNNNNNAYNYQQLLQLPALPFLDDIRKKQYTLINVKGWVIGKKVFRRFKNLFTFRKRKTTMDTNTNITKYSFDSTTPLYQYYVTGQLTTYDYKHLNSLPKYPFLHDIHNFNTINFFK